LALRSKILKKLNNLFKNKAKSLTNNSNSDN
jgi:hypothetical protein